MKIIKKGTKTPPNKQVYVIKCRTCGCIFTYKEEDMRGFLRFVRVYTLTSVEMTLRSGEYND